MPTWDISETCLHPDRQPTFNPEDYDASGGEILECPDCGEIWMTSPVSRYIYALNRIEDAYFFTLYA